MKRWLLLVPVLALLSCGNGGDHEKADTAVVTKNSIPRLAKYYPLDSLGANGDTLYHTIPADTFLAQNGRAFVTTSVNGKVVVNDFFFASCGGTCPRMTSQLTRVQEAFRGNPDVAIVSYTVDPARDSVASLQLYAQRFHADTAQWKFITGKKKNLYDLARYGFYLPVEPGNGDSEDFIHSDQLVLVDRHARIRGYYGGTDPAAVDSLIADVKTLLREQ